MFCNYPFKFNELYFLIFVVSSLLIRPLTGCSKKSEALEKPLSTKSKSKMTENYLVKLLFGLILTRFVDSEI